jgi:hypothetical protein
LKKIICSLLIVAFACSGCALAAGLVAGSIASEIIKRTTDLVTGEKKKDDTKYQDLLKDKNAQEIR